MARNSHKAAYHAVLLNQLDPVYIYPDYVSDFGFQGGISPEEIEAAFAAAGGRIVTGRIYRQYLLPLRRMRVWFQISERSHRLPTVMAFR